MKCECCSKDFTAPDVTVKEGNSVDDDVEIRIACPHCEQGYYNFIPLTDFCLDEAAPGKPPEPPVAPVKITIRVRSTGGDNLARVLNHKIKASSTTSDEQAAKAAAWKFFKAEFKLRRTKQGCIATNDPHEFTAEVVS